jgi:hypothetical protein
MFITRKVGLHSSKPFCYLLNTTNRDRTQVFPTVEADQEEQSNFCNKMSTFWEVKRLKDALRPFP